MCRFYRAQVNTNFDSDSKVRKAETLAENEGLRFYLDNFVSITLFELSFEREGQIFREKMNIINNYDM